MFEPNENSVPRPPPVYERGKDLSPNAVRFAREYAIDHKTGAAALRAGYTTKNHSQIGSNLLRDPRVQAVIKEEEKKSMEKFGITKDRILQELALIAFSNPQDHFQRDENGNLIIDLSGISREKAAAMGISVETSSSGKMTISKVKAASATPAEKQAALIALGKHVGLFKDQVEHQVTLSLEQLIEQSYKDDESMPELEGEFSEVELLDGPEDVAQF